MSMLCFMVTDSRVNRDQLMKICMVHDLAESVVGDITPHCGVSKEEKRRLEEVSCRLRFCYAICTRRSSLSAVLSVRSVRSYCSCSGS